MEFDLNHVPFSRRGTFLAISLLPEAANRQQGLYLRTVRGGDDKFGEAFRIELIDANGQSLAYREQASQERLLLDAGEGRQAEICLPDGRTFRFRARGCGVRLTFASSNAYDYAYGYSPATWEVNSFTHECRFRLDVLGNGELRMEVPWDKIKSSRIVAEFRPPVAPAASMMMESSASLGIAQSDSADRTTSLGLDEAGSANRTASLGLDEAGFANRMTSLGLDEAGSANRTASLGLDEAGFANRMTSLGLDEAESADRTTSLGSAKAKSVDAIAQAAQVDSASSTSDLEFVIREYRTVIEPLQQAGLESFDEAVSNIRDEFAEWLAGCPQTDNAAYGAGRELAAYITWSCLVPAEGCLTRSAMYMSKNWMTNIWSWDHCFNAMALVGHDPKLAWDQFMIFFDRQDESGLIPDFVNDKYELWNCNKPPIHGWTLAWMMERTDFIQEAQLQEVYGPLSKWTNWWFTHRDNDGDGIAQYNHGNDSGWDNSTVFNNGIPVESPDLSTFLILQAETLARIATKLGKPAEEAAAWQKLADDTQEKMLRHFWRGDRFIACKSGTHEESAGDSLVLFMPILLGKRLPESIRSALLEGLKEGGRFLTANGWATESPSSPFYQADGYWRGPIWAPSTMLLVEGVTAAGDPALAREAAKRFCAMASASGMAENFDALTGEGLRDRAFTWTSSVYLVLASEYAR